MSTLAENNQTPECIICQDIFYQPVTLPCGHSYCRECIKQGLKSKPLCPTCRNPMIGNPDNLPINFTLQQIIESNYKQQYDLRKNEMDKKINLSQSSNLQSNRISNSSGQNLEKQKIQNVLVLQLNKTKYLFPNTTVNVQLKYQDSLEQLLMQGYDKRVIIYFTKNEQKIASYCQILQIFNSQIEKNKSHLKCEVKVFSRIQIVDIKETKVDYSESKIQDQVPQQTQNNQQINQQNNNQQNNDQNNDQQNNNNDANSNQQNNVRLFQDGFTFKVAEGLVIQDSAVPSEQETGIQEHTEALIKQIEDIISHNGGFNQSTYELQAILQKQNFLLYLSNGYINNMTRVQDFCWIVCGVFNFTLTERERLWDADSLIERLALLKEFIKKFEQINNITSVFDIEAPGHSDNVHLIIFGVIIAFFLLKYFNYIG